MSWKIILRVLIDRSPKFLQFDESRRSALLLTLDIVAQQPDQFRHVVISRLNELNADYVALIKQKNYSPAGFSLGEFPTLGSYAIVADEDVSRVMIDSVTILESSNTNPQDLASVAASFAACMMTMIRADLPEVEFAQSTDRFQTIASILEYLSFDVRSLPPNAYPIA